MTNIIQSYQNQRFIKSSNESPSVRFIMYFFILLIEELLCKGKGGVMGALAKPSRLYCPTRLKQSLG
ncbi:hypothetical protein, partial [Paenibacillus ehimensis]|uniref:hypothetical protein n=1 Tax=Paenibacillus ehimensis TaxID=79264 RepID=UPI001C3F8854